MCARRQLCSERTLLVLAKFILGITPHNDSLTELSNEDTLETSNDNQKFPNFLFSISKRRSMYGTRI